MTATAPATPAATPAVAPAIADLEFELPVKSSDFAAGMVYGLTGDNHYHTIKDCFTPSETMKTDLSQAINYFRHFDFLGGVKDIGDIII